MAELHDMEDIAPGMVRVRTENGWLYCHGKIKSDDENNVTATDFRLMTYVPDTPTFTTSELLPRSGLTQKQIRARRKNAEKARDSLAKAKSDKID